MVNKKVKLLKNKHGQTIWNKDKQKKCFTSIDRIQVLTDNTWSQKYWNTLKFPKIESSELWRIVVKYRINKTINFDLNIKHNFNMYLTWM